MQQRTPTVTLINKSTVLPDDRVSEAIPALQTQLSRDLIAFWGKTATLEQDSKPSAFATPLWLYDNADVPHALGYHEDPNGIPDIKVFVGTTIDAGLSWTVTVSHELIEFPVDPTCSATARFFPYRYALEVCDPVELDAFAYTIDNVLVSDFITPAWFGPARRNVRYDFMQHCLAPRVILQGGYQLRYDPFHGWRQLVAQNGPVQARKIRSALDLAHRPGSSGRSLKRLRALHS